MVTGMQIPNNLLGRHQRLVGTCLPVGHPLSALMDGAATATWGIDLHLHFGHHIPTAWLSVARRRVMYRIQVPNYSQSPMRTRVTLKLFSAWHEDSSGANTMLFMLSVCSPWFGDILVNSRSQGRSRDTSALGLPQSSTHTNPLTSSGILYNYMHCQLFGVQMHVQRKWTIDGQRCRHF